MAKGLREKVGKQYTGTQRTRKAVHGECTVELAKWTFPIIVSFSREPYEVVSLTYGSNGGHDCAVQARHRNVIDTIGYTGTR